MAVEIVAAAAPGSGTMGGETGALVRAKDWSATPLGPIGGWPQSLRTVVDLVLVSPLAMVALWGPDLIQIYNDAYAAITADKHPAALGQLTRECWPEVWDFNAPIYEAVFRGEARSFSGQKLTILRNGILEDAWFDLTYSPLRDVAGAAAGVLVTVIETTARVVGDASKHRQAEEALRQSEARLRITTEANGIGIWELTIQGGTTVAVTPPRHDTIFGYTEPVREWNSDIALSHFAPEDREVVAQKLQNAIATGGTWKFEARIRHQCESSLRWIEAQGQPVERNADGRAVRFIGVVQDITEHKAAEERQALLSREVDHRAKNVLAVMQAALRLTTAPDLPRYMQAIEGRVGALARAQTLLADDRWAGAELRTLLRGELAAFVDTGNERPRVELAGPTVALPAGATQPLAMAVHELATNALKYGALSMPPGRIAVSWHLDGGALGTLRLRWVEAGGPPIAGPPTRRGFGSRMLNGTVRGQLGGTLSLSWATKGLATRTRTCFGRCSGRQRFELMVPSDLHSAR